MGISQIYLCIMKNSGRTMRSTVYGSSAVVLNLLLNTLLIFGLLGFPKMEIAGRRWRPLSPGQLSLDWYCWKTGRKTRCVSG